MPRSSHKKHTRVMVGCSRSKTHKHTKKHNCPNCGSNCKCGKNCNCPRHCTGNCNKGSIYGGCGNCLSLKGGANFYKPATPISGPIIGDSWGTSVKQWPGIDGIGSNRNFLNENINVYKNPSYQQSMNDSGYNYLNSKVGGYKYNKIKKNVSFSLPHKSSKSHKSIKSHQTPKYKKYKRGGGLIPQDLLNLGEEVGFNVKSTYNALNGYPSPVPPLPYQGQITGKFNMK